MNNNDKLNLKLKGEATGAFLVGIIESFKTAKALPPGALNIGSFNTNDLKPDNWYPLQHVYELMDYLYNTISPPPSIFFMAGVNFINNWYHYGPGKERVFSSKDWIFANENSEGYRSVVRGGSPEEVGSVTLTDYDEEKGIALYDNITLWHSEYLEGIFYGGFKLFDDLDFLKIIVNPYKSDSHHPLLTFSKVTIHFRYKKDITISNKIEDILLTHDKEPIQSIESESLNSLLWQYKYLIYKYNKEKSYREDLFNLLKNSLEESTQLGEELKEAKEKAEEANKAKTIFLASMSHEIRTPLNAMILAGKLLSSVQKEEERKRLLDILEISGNSLMSLISNILDISKIESSNMTLVEKSIDLYKLINDIDTIFSFQCKDKGLKFIIEYSENLPKYIKVDNIRLRQILINFLGNAIKFTEKGFITLKVNLKENINSPNSIRFSISDSGIGMTKEQSKIIFDEFVQADKKIFNKFGGTGLGLSINKKFITMMKGEISVESNVGEGTTFTFDIPLTIGEKLEVEISNKKNQLDKQNINVLVVDDDEVNRYLAKILFKDNGYKIETAQDANEALRKIQEIHFNIIFLDINMPDIDGYELQKLMRKEFELQGKSIPIIALSASTMLEDREISLQEGFQEHMGKPYKMKDIDEICLRFIK
ncbi:MAG: response regulator [Leptospiraceae bacterium]|nr:response regulator [Leptospiraceae bacterium]